MSNEEILKLAGDELQAYIIAHTHEDEKKLLLRHKSILGLPSPLVAQQISARKKAELKIPSFFRTKGIIYPPSINLEQSSSEITAKFKAKIIREEIAAEKLSGVDLTGGFGIDSFFLSQIADSFVYVEPNAELVEIARLNFDLLGNSTVQFHNQSAEDFLEKASSHYDFIFVDPSRRDSKSRKVFGLRDCSPDIASLLPALLKRTDFVLIKASPLLDIKQGLRELVFIKKILVVSVSNEVKELLFLIQKDFNREPLIQTFNLDYEGAIKDTFEFLFSDEECSLSKFSSPKKYLYEPNVSILKAGAFKAVGERFNLSKLHVNTHLYTSDAVLSNFPGRVFEIEQMDFDSKTFSDRKANVIARNYPLSPEELKKKLKLKDGGDKYVIAFSGQEKKFVILAKRLA
jgi:hypothetical protein